MGLKRKLNKEEHAKLGEHLQTLYVEEGDSYRLDLDDDDVGALKRAKDREVQLRKDAEKKAKEFEEKLGEIEGNDARKRGDIQTLEKSWQEKIDKQKAEYEARVGKLAAHTTRTLVDNVAMSIATKISNAPALILPHIKARLQADFEGDEPRTRVLDKDGKPSALTTDELSAEFVSNKDFAAVITASRASGGARSLVSGGANVSNGQAPSDLSKMKPAELVDHLRSLKSQS